MAVFKSFKYSYNLTTVKRYGNNFIRLQTMNVQRTPHTVKPYSFDSRPRPVGSSFKSYDTKLNESLIRSRRMVFEYAFSNPWQYFVTLTLDKTKYDRFDLNKFHSDFSQWLRNYFRRKFDENVQYLLIPEQHSNGAWHLHGLLGGISVQHFIPFVSSSKLPKYILDKLFRGEIIYNFPAYQKKFGYCTVEPIRNQEACAKYITKYISKDLVKSVTSLNSHLYYCSRSLNKAEVISVGYYNGTPFYDFTNDYCKFSTFAYSADFEKCILGKIRSEL